MTHLTDNNLTNNLEEPRLIKQGKLQDRTATTLQQVIPYRTTAGPARHQNLFNVYIYIQKGTPWGLRIGNLYLD